jgi:hypothetical protein
MKKYIKLGLLLSALITTSQADIQLTIIDKDGNQNSQCIKSYSFSNNLESIARQNVSGKEIYSLEEVMTNKIFLGKPVYRKMIDTGIRVGEWSTPHGLEGIFEKIWVEDFLLGDTTMVSSAHSHIENNHKYYASVGDTHVFPRRTDIYEPKQTYVILEYTKKADSVVTNNENTFKSYLHYIPSSSTINEPISIDLKETGVRFLDNYTYDSSTNSCTN